MQGKIACQKTSGRAQASGAVHREVRVIWRKSDYLKPSLQKAEFSACRKDACNRCRPCGMMSSSTPQSSGAGAMPSEGIQGDGRDA
jgi:hypothetical protein